MKALLAQARGEQKADLVFKNGLVADVFTGELVARTVAVAGGVILGYGDYQGKTEVDLAGRVLVPGFIDGHCHVESGMVGVGEFARRLVALGTTTIFADPHEIANVAGLAGINWLLAEAKNYPWNFYLMLPACVPASPWETAGAILEAQDLAQLADQEGVFGLGEVMNFVGVVAGDDNLWRKLELMQGRFIDGHAPGLSGKELNAYLLGGIRADHEITDPTEAAEKISAGMHVMVREGSAARNLAALLPAINERNQSRFLFATDDRDPTDLLAQGHINYMVRRACQLGLAPMEAIRLATINTARCLGLNDVGAIAPGYKADLVILNDTKEFQVTDVYKDGRLVAQNGQPLFAATTAPIPEAVGKSINIGPITAQNFELPQGERFRVIELIPGEIVTRQGEAKASELEPMADHDLVRLAVVERHHKSGRVGLGLLRGLGLKKGAVATSIAHDSHHIIVAGITPEDMALAVQAVADQDGGLVVVQDGQVTATLALALGGLMSTEPLETVAANLENLELKAKDLGVGLKSPFMALSFLALPVIPTLKLTDRGLFDTNDFKPVDLIIE